MWLFAGFSAWLTEEVADGTDAFTLFFSLLPRCRPPSTSSSLLGDQVSLRPSVQRERRKKGRRRAVLINGRKPDDEKGRRETDRPHNLPTYQNTAITSLSPSFSRSLLCSYL